MEQGGERCGLEDALLQEYLDGVLEPGLRRRVEQHLAGCIECAMSAASYRHVRTRLSSLPLFAPGLGFDHDVLAAVLPRRDRLFGLSPVTWLAACYVLFTGGLLAAALALGGVLPPGGPVRSWTQLWHDALHLALRTLDHVASALSLARHLGEVLAVLAAQTLSLPRLLALAWATPEGRFYLALSACTALAFFLLARRSPKGGPIVTAAI